MAIKKKFERKTEQTRPLGTLTTKPKTTKEFDPLPNTVRDNQDPKKKTSK